MIRIQITAKTQYIRTLNTEDEEKVRQLMKEKDLDVEDAVRELFAFCDMPICSDNDEFEFYSDSIDDVWEDDF